MGRRRRRVIKVVKKKLPTVFSCPSCGEEAIRVVMSRGKGHATVQCASCGLKQEIETSPADQMVDVYCRFTDKFYGTTQPATLNQAEAPPGGPVPSETQQVQDEERPAEVQLSSEAAPSSAEQQSEPKSSEQASEGLELDLN